MKLTELTKALEAQHTITLASGVIDERLVNRVHFLQEGETANDATALYVGSCKKVSFEADIPVMLITAVSPNDSPGASPAVSPTAASAAIPTTIPSNSIVLLSQLEALNTVANAALKLLLDELHKEAEFFEFSYRFSNSSDLQKAIDAAANMMGNAIILTDIADRVIAASSVLPLMDPLWAACVAQGYLDDDFVRKVRKNLDMIEWQKKNSLTQIITLDGDIQPKLVTQLELDGRAVGGAVMIAHHRPVSLFMRRQFPLVAELLLKTYLRGRGEILGGMQDSSQGQALYALLNEEQTEEAEVTIKKLDKLAAHSGMRVAVARYDERTVNHFLRRTLHLELQLIFPQGVSVVWRGSVGILIDKVSPEQLIALDALAESTGIRVGISWPFFEIRQFRRHYYEALDVVKLLQVVQSPRRVSEFTGMMPADLLSNYAGAKPLLQYRHPALELLRHTDERRHTVLYDTLRSFVRNGRCLKTTAEVNIIHRNTLSYRLQQIRQITKLDISDDETFIALYFSFLIDDLLRE